MAYLVAYYLGLACAAAMAACVFLRRARAALLLSAAASMSIALATAMRFGSWGAELAILLSPAIIGSVIAAILYTTGRWQSTAAGAVAPAIFLVSVLLSTIQFSCEWDRIDAAAAYGFGYIDAIVVAICAAYFLHLPTGHLSPRFGMISTRLAACTLLGWAIACYAAYIRIALGGWVHCESFVLAGTTTGYYAVALPALAQSWESEGNGARIAALSAMILPCVLLAEHFPWLPLLAAAIAFASMKAAGQIVFSGIILLASIIACGILAWVGYDAISQWLSTSNDPYGAGYAPRLVAESLTTLLPGMDALGFAEACRPYTDYSLAGAAHTLGTIGLLVYGACLCSLIVALARTWKENGALTALAAAVLIGIASIASVADQTALLPLYNVDLPFISCARYMNASFVFAVVLGILDGLHGFSAFQGCKSRAPEPDEQDVREQGNKESPKDKEPSTEPDACRSLWDVLEQ